MRGGFIRYIPSVQSSKSLVFRGGLVHTFGSLAGFIVVTFLCVGLYILEEGFANPLDAGAAAVITAAFIITLAVMLLVFLLEPGKRIRTANPDRAADSATAELKPISKPVAGAVRHDHLRSNLSYQRFYVDHSRIRPSICSWTQARGIAGK